MVARIRHVWGVLRHTVDLCYRQNSQLLRPDVVNTSIHEQVVAGALWLLSLSNERRDVLTLVP